MSKKIRIILASAAVLGAAAVPVTMAAAPSATAVAAAPASFYHG